MSTTRRVYITGIAGFVGFHLARHCLRLGWKVAGADSLSPYYSPHLKVARLRELERDGRPDIAIEDLALPGTAARLLSGFGPDVVFHLAARPGARETDATALERDNIAAFSEMLSAIGSVPGITHFLFASSSSVYGGSASHPLREDAVLKPLGPYGISKATNESSAKANAKAGGPPATALRFFNVYGPWGRPDMAMFRFAEALSKDRPVTLNNGGQSARALLYVDDAVRACVRLAGMPPGDSENRFRPVNIAGPALVRTRDVLSTIARWAKKAPRVVCEEAREPAAISADLSRLHSLTGEVPQTTFRDGVVRFLRWHREWLREQRVVDAGGFRGDGGDAIALGGQGLPGDAEEVSRAATASRSTPALATTGPGMNIAVIGGGHVGLPVAAVFAEAGNRVVCCERDPSRLRLLRAGRAPFGEPGLGHLIDAGLRRGTLAFAEDAAQAVGQAELCFVTVETSATDGHRRLRETAASVAQGMPDGSAIVLKSTMQPMTADSVAAEIGDRVKVAVNPEFLSQGCAVEDFRAPVRIVVGTGEESTLDKLRTLYSPWRDRGVPWFEVSRTEAEIVKVSANSFRATNIALINEISGLCAAVGGDIRAVRDALVADSRIGESPLIPGIGFGGSCLPKDCELLALAGKAGACPMKVVDAVIASNQALRERLAARVAGLVRNVPDPVLVLWGVAFKPDSDDIRGSIALDIAERVAQVTPGLQLRLHDPHLNGTTILARGKLSGDWRESLCGADGLAVLVAHSAFRGIRRKDIGPLMRNDRVLDLVGILGA